MKRTLFIAAIIIGVLLLITAIGSAVERVWVTSEDATLQAERSSTSAIVSQLKRGTQLTVNAYEKRWYRVTTPDGKTGWIYRGKVSDSQPEISEEKEEEGGIGDLLGGLSGSSIEADAGDSARSIRGLSPEAQAYAKTTGKSMESQEALDKLLSLTIKPNEIDLFLKQGKIGEYAQ